MFKFITNPLKRRLENFIIRTVSLNIRNGGSIESAVTGCIPLEVLFPFRHPKKDPAEDAK